MAHKIEILPAQKKDIPFLAQMIVMAETSGFELFSYMSMFSLETGQMVKKLEHIIDNEQRGHGLGYLSFLIATVDGVPAATASGYIEGQEGSSSHLMTGALMSAFTTSEVVAAYGNIRKYKPVNVDKTPGTLQVDSVATLPQFRGMGLFRMIFNEHCNTAKGMGCTGVEIQVWKGNEGAIKTYEKLGLIQKIEKTMPDSNGRGKILMHKTL